jgi:phosphatidate cytidylyltransferase
MLAKRVLVAVILLPFGIAAILLGGWVYVGVIALILSLAAWEYGNLFRAGGLQPAGALLILGVIVIALGRALDEFQSAPALLSALVLLSMTYHLVSYERGREQAGTDFSVTLGGMFYIGWIGAYLVSLRMLPEGLWWFLLVLPAVWLADSGAYFFGSAYGRHKLSPRLSPKKTWEGYLAGIVAGTLGGALLAVLLRLGAGAGSELTIERGAIMGFVLGIFPTLGDLGESMFKRQAGVKDSSNLLPGHGGAFDRIDSWLWAGVIGYYVITWFWI